MKNDFEILFYQFKNLCYDELGDKIWVLWIIQFLILEEVMNVLRKKYFK